MTEFVQNSSLLLGAYEDIKELSQKDKARILVVSDSHWGVENLFSILTIAGKDCDALVFCGDGIEDLGKVLNRASCTPDFQEYLPKVIALVKGNNDEQLYFFNSMAVQVPREQLLKAAGHTIYIAHGHHFSLYTGLHKIYEQAKTCKADIVLFGHSHVATVAVKHRQHLILNPGSCSLPRGGQPRTFAILSLQKNKKPAYEFFTFDSQKASNFSGFIKDRV